MGAALYAANHSQLSVERQADEQEQRPSKLLNVVLFSRIQ